MKVKGIFPFFSRECALRATEFVEALTAATEPEDLVDEFAWFEDWFLEFVQIIRNRATLVYGCTTPQGSVPAPTRALNNEVAYMMMRTLGLAFNIRLTEIRSATHLIGREGVIRGQDPADNGRLRGRLDDGTCVNLKSC